jgi:catechol 2,3-dioxygenase-like lactoylglutathione lyase family enzyme
MDADAAERMKALKKRILPGIVLGCLLAVQLSLGSFQDRPSIALDHVVLAVNDLEATSARYRQFGFALKPGQPHANGIRNQHVKFTDGTELELLTAPEAADDLTTRYRRHLADGDGPAYLALFPRPNAPARSEAPSYIFFGRRNQSPTDRPEHFAHLNSADSLIAVWLAGSDFTQERALLKKYGVSSQPGRLGALNETGEMLSVTEGVIYLVPERLRVHRARPIIGVTFHVGDHRAAVRVLTEAGVQFRTLPNSVLLAPAVTGGVWIELTERRLSS